MEMVGSYMDHRRVNHVGRRRRLKYAQQQELSPSEMSGYLQRAMMLRHSLASGPHPRDYFLPSLYILATRRVFLRSTRSSGLYGIVTMTMSCAALLPRLW
jgi:hypothetical protein